MLGIISSVSGDKYRVAFSDGTVSAEIPALKSVYRLKIDFEAKTWEEQPPKAGDRVLCWFAGKDRTNGCIVGLLEGSS